MTYEEWQLNRDTVEMEGSVWEEGASKMTLEQLQWVARLIASLSLDGYKTSDILQSVSRFIWRFIVDGDSQNRSELADGEAEYYFDYWRNSACEALFQFVPAVQSQFGNRFFYSDEASQHGSTTGAELPACVSGLDTASGSGL